MPGSWKVKTHRSFPPWSWIVVNDRFAYGRKWEAMDELVSSGKLVGTGKHGKVQEKKKQTGDIWRVTKRFAFPAREAPNTVEQKRSLVSVSNGSGRVITPNEPFVSPDESQVCAEYRGTRRQRRLWILKRRIHFGDAFIIAYQRRVDCV